VIFWVMVVGDGAGEDGEGAAHVLLETVHAWPVVQVAVPQVQGAVLAVVPSVLAQVCTVEETPALQSPVLAAVTVATPVAAVMQAHSVAPFRTVPSLLEHATRQALEDDLQYCPVGHALVPHLHG